MKVTIEDTATAASPQIAAGLVKEIVLGVGVAPGQNPGTVIYPVKFAEFGFPNFVDSNYVLQFNVLRRFNKNTVNGSISFAPLEQTAEGFRVQVTYDLYMPPSDNPDANIFDLSWLAIEVAVNAQGSS